MFYKLTTTSDLHRVTTLASRIIAPYTKELAVGCGYKPEPVYGECM
jgi:hypothetical protein